MIMANTKNEVSFLRILFGTFLIIAGIGTYKTWINYPIPTDFWGSLFMNFGVVYPVTGIAVAVYGAYFILTSSYPSTGKEAKEYVNDNGLYLVMLVWILSILILPKFISMDLVFVVTMVGGVIVLIILALSKPKK